MKFSIQNHFAILSFQNSVLDLEKHLSKNKNYKGAFFSEATLKSMVEEEARRDTSVIFEREGQTLRSMSSGERKIAVLNYLLSLKRDYLVVENFYENLDVQNREKLEALLIEVAQKTTIIQVVRKEQELFSFVKHFYKLSINQELIPYKKSVTHFLENTAATFSEISIPETTTKYVYNYKTFVKLADVGVKFYGKPILQNITWEIKLGEFWQLVGENGTGKTTLLSLITGDSHKAYGQNIVLFDKLKGTEENVWEIKQKIGYFTPNITELFNRRHSVLHMVLSGFYDSVGLYVKPLDIHIKLAKQWIDLIQLSDVTHKTFATLSLGQQRLVLIARAMVKHPPLLILDEPTSGLDTENAALVTALVNKFAKESNTTIIYVSHILEKGLYPDTIYKLSKTKEGSTGSVLE